MKNEIITAKPPPDCYWEAEFRRVRKQRDDLLAACKALIEWRESCDNLPTDIGLIGVYHRQRAAVRKAEARHD